MKFQVAMRWALLALACFAPGVGAMPQLLVPLAPSAAAPPAARPAPGIPVRFNAAEMFALRPQSEAALTLPDGTTHPYVFELAQDHGGGIRSWVGRHRDLGTRHRVVVTTGPAGSYGALSTPTAEYRLRPGPSSDLLIDARTEPEPAVSAGDALVPRAVAKSSAARVHAPSPFLPKAGFDSVVLPKATPTPSFDVDLMIIYNRGLATQLGDSLTTQLHFLVTRTNTALADSEIAVRVRLVRAVQVEYEEPVNDLTAIYAVTPACRPTNACPVPFDEKAFGHVEAMREAAGADLVMLLRNFGGGRAWVGGEPPGPLFMYSVVGCAPCESVFAHELGHNMGLWHDRATTAFQAGGTSFYPQGVRPYAYGYAYCASGALSCNPELPPGSGGCTADPQCSTQNPENFSELMAYFGGSTVKNFKFSNPRITCSGSGGFSQPCGIPDGMAGSADAAQAINEFRASLSAIKATVDPPAPPPTFVRFAAPHHFAPESGMAVSVPVRRQGTAPGTLQVRYRTRNGTALAGLDYTAAEGILSWGENDFAAKTIQVPIADDGVAEGGEFFTLELIEPSGSVEAYVDGASTTTVVITEDWPAGGAMPAGFSTPNGSNGAWTVATDHAFEGSASLRSAQVFGFPGRSQVSFTGQFEAGFVAFAYRVSMFPHPRTIFEFAIDGRVVMQVGGESGWQLFSAPISAGMHQLTWTVVNFETSTCSGHPEAPGGASCADRAWIDAVMLPLALPAAGVALDSSPNPSQGGHPVTLTATLAGTQGSPTGFVAFRDGPDSIVGCARVPIQSARAVCTTNALPAGMRTIGAQYSGNSTYAGGTTASISHRVDSTTAPAGKKKIDFNADGLADLAWQHSSGSSGVWLMNGTSFSAFASVSGGAGTTIRQVGDFNGNGMSDILWRASNGAYTITLMNGTSAASPVTVLPAGTGWENVGKGDFNGDGKTDLLWKSASGVYGIWLMDGTTFTAGVMSAPGPGWNAVLIGDYNGDGKSDVLWRHTDGRVMLYLQDGFSSSASTTLLGPNTGWTPIQTADFDGDGKTDLIWSRNNGEAGLWLMDGTTIRSYHALIGPNTGWSITLATDLNADGKSDLIWAHTNGQQGAWLMDGASPSAFGAITAAGDGWKVVASDDTNGDGRGDLIFRHTNGAYRIWLMSGMAAFAQASLLGAGTGWALTGNP